MIRRFVKRVGFASMLAAVSACGSVEGDHAWGAGFDVGAYEVGFRSEQLVRTAADGSTRRLTLSVWYPATPTRSDVPLIMADLFRMVVDEGQLSEVDGLSLERGFAAAMTGDSMSISRARAIQALAAATLSRMSAPSAAGRFPLALWSARHATVLAQGPLSEVLASHGLVVATVWSSDPPLAFIWEDRPDEEKQATIEAQTEDLVHVLRRLGSDPSVDVDRTTVLAWSYGGQTAARLQQREETVAGVVSLDANVVSASSEGRLELRRPLVYVIGEDNTGRGFERLGALSVPWVAVRFPALAHGNFNALEGYLPGLYEADTVFAWSRGGEVARDGYQALARMVTAAVASLSSDSTLDMTELAQRLGSVAGPFATEIQRPESSR